MDNREPILNAGEFIAARRKSFGLSVGCFGATAQDLDFDDESHRGRWLGFKYHSVVDRIMDILLIENPADQNLLHTSPVRYKTRTSTNTRAQVTSSWFPGPQRPQIQTT